MDITERDQWREADQLFQSLIDLDDEARRRAIEAAAPSAPVRAKLAALLRSEIVHHRLLDSDPGELVWSRAGATPANDPTDENCGRRVGDWQLFELLGRGGMAAVYRARRADQDYEQHAAVKLLSVALHSPSEQARFRRERQILAQLQHPHVAGLIDAGLDAGGTPYLVMHLVEGQRIDRYCEAHGLSIRQRVELLLQVCSAVAYAHRQLVIHRDIKPGNILVDEHGHATLLDFGIARLLDSEETAEATVTHAFTPDYAAPEQRSLGQHVLGTSVDVYGIGAVLYRLLTGVPPEHDSHGDPVPASAIARRNNDTRKATNLRGDLDSILAQSLATEPQQRYAGIDALAGDLRAWLQYRPLLARRANAWLRARKFMRRNRVACALAALVILVASAGLIAFAVNHRALQRRAAELQAVTKFQIDMLQQIVPQDVGAHLHKALTDAVPPPAAGTDTGGLQAAIAKIDYTGLAIDMLDEAILHRSVKAARKRFVNQPRVEGLLLQQLAIDYRDLGRFEQARPIQSEATTVLQKALGDGDPLTLASMREQLKLVRRLNLPDGEARHRKVLQLHIRYLGNDAVDTENARGALAQWLMSHGKARQAESLLRTVAARLSQLKGSDNPDTVATRINLAFAVSAQGRYAESVPLFRSVARDAKKVFGPDAPFTLNSLDNLAYVLNHSGHPDQAENLYRKVYQASRRTLGEKHRATLTSLNNYAVSLREHGKPGPAEPLQREAYRGISKALGPDHPETLHVGMNLARDYLALNQYNKAITLLEPIAAASKKMGNKRALAQTQRLIGRGLQGLGRLQAAQRAYLRSWDLASAIRRVPEQRKTAKALIGLFSGPDRDARQLGLWQDRLQRLEDGVAASAN